MDESTRRAYLEAMGIPVWLSRGSEPEAAATEPAPAAVSATAAPAEVPATVEAEGRDAEPAQAADSGARPGPVGRAGTGERPEPSPSAASGTDVAAMDADALREAILACTACGLCETRTQAVPGVGNATADLLVIGEAPGQEEDRRGEPFVGRAGQLLDRMLAAIGLDRGTVYITNVLKCRPPKNRDPRAEEALACAPFLRRQIELIAPKAILAVGRVSAQQLLETDRPIGKLRGQWHRFGPRNTPLRITYHPAYLLRSPGEKRKAWEDLKAVRAALRE